MRVLVVGEHGQVGAALAAHAGTRHVVAACSAAPTADLTDPRSACAAAIARLSPDVVVNAAAYTAVDKAEDEPERRSRVNATAPAIVAAAAAAAGAPLIHVSTDYVFDGAQDRRPIVETDPVAPLGVYGAEARRRGGGARARRRDHVILRTAWVLRPGRQQFREDHAAPRRRRATSCASSTTSAAAPTRPRPRRRARAIARAAVAGHGAGAPSTSPAPARPRGAGFARRSSRRAATGGPPAGRARSPTADYPTPARAAGEFACSTARSRRTFGIRQPAWREGLDTVTARHSQRGALRA